MAAKVIMPALGMVQDSGVLLAWLKEEGEEVRKGEPLMEIETDKATVEVDAPASGILSGVTAGPGDEVPVAEVVGWILAPGEALPEKSRAAGAPVATASKASGVGARQTEAAPTATTEAAASPVAARVAATHNVDLGQVPGSGQRITKADVLAYVASQEEAGVGAIEARLAPASPKARRLAQEEGLELGQIMGSGPDGAVLTADVLEAAQAAEAVAPVAPEGQKTVAVSNAWRVMVQRLGQAWNEIPHFYLLREVDAERLIAWRTMLKERGQAGITYTDLLVKLVAAALRRYPRANASWRDGSIVRNEQINVGLAVAVADGLVVPVIHDADRQTLPALAEKRQALVARAQEGRLRLEDLQAGTFTVSNLGMYGIDAFNAIVNPPQAAILAVGRIAERVVPVAGEPAVRSMMALTLSCDHRVVDGARGAEFLDALAALVEEPLGLIE